MIIDPRQLESIRALVIIEAIAEVMDVPQAKIALILAKARQEMGGKP